jgi:hypothetical protein
MVRCLAVFILVGMTLVWPRLSLAEIVELSGGEWVEGKLREVTPAGVVIEVGGQTVTFPSDRVQAIYFRSPSQAPPAPPAGPPPPAPPGAPASTPSGAVPAASPALPARPSPATVFKSPSPTADALLGCSVFRSAVLGGLNFREGRRG